MEHPGTGRRVCAKSKMEPSGFYFVCCWREASGMRKLCAVCQEKCIFHLIKCFYWIALVMQCCLSTAGEYKLLTCRNGKVLHARRQIGLSSIEFSSLNLYFFIIPKHFPLLPLFKQTESCSKLTPVMLLGLIMQPLTAFKAVIFSN